MLLGVKGFEVSGVLLDRLGFGRFPSSKLEKGLKANMREIITFIPIFLHLSTYEDFLRFRGDVLEVLYLVNTSLIPKEQSK